MYMNQTKRLTSPNKRVGHILDRSISTLNMAAAGMEVLFSLQHLLIDTHREKGGEWGLRQRNKETRAS